MCVCTQFSPSHTRLVWRGHRRHLLAWATMRALLLLAVFLLVIKLLDTLMRDETRQSSHKTMRSKTVAPTNEIVWGGGIVEMNIIHRMLPVHIITKPLQKICVATHTTHTFFWPHKILSHSLCHQQWRCVNKKLYSTSGIAKWQKLFVNMSHGSGANSTPKDN